MNSSMNSVNNTSMNTSANISAAMNNNTQAGMPTANAGMNNGATTSSVWHDPAIIRQMEGAPSQNMMELLRERTEQQAHRMPPLQHQSSFQQYRQNQQLMRQRSQQFNQQLMMNHQPTFFTQTE